MVTCATCGRENPADARFCNSCGAALTAAPEPRREERKIVTVLFADLVGFTSRAERLDPEDVRALLDPYWRHLRDELERFGGTVEKFIGDAVMALFGAPLAHEDDPERAVRAARATIEAVSSAPLVGRADELDLLVGSLQRARRDREPQLVTVAGVPGIGKSRLVAELYAVVDEDDEIIAWRRGRCLSYGVGISLWALGEIVKAELGVLESDSRAETEAKLATALEGLSEDPSERAWLERQLAALAGLPAEPGERADSFAAWRRFIEALA